jgi:hypothetical protein
VRQQRFRQQRRWSHPVESVFQGEFTMAAKRDQGQHSPATAEPREVEQHVRQLLQKLTAHVKQKSVDGARPIKADREKNRSGLIADV